MAFGQPSWILEALLAYPEEQRAVQSFNVAEHVYATTAGPWGGIGGAALTSYTMTLLEFPEGWVIFADKRRMGRVKDECVDEMLRRFPEVKAEWIEKEDR